MPFFEEIKLADSIEIKAQPADVFRFLTGIVDDDAYMAWHEEDHAGFRWLKGPPWTVGSVMQAEEYLHGRLHKFKFTVTEIVPDKSIEYMPASRMMRFYFPRNEFKIEQKKTGVFLLRR